MVLPSGTMNGAGSVPFFGNSNVWKPVARNLILSPTWTVVPCGKKSLTSEPRFWSFLAVLPAVPIVTTRVAALADTGKTTATQNAPSAPAAHLVLCIQPLLGRPDARAEHPEPGDAIRVGSPGASAGN